MAEAEATIQMRDPSGKIASFRPYQVPIKQRQGWVEIGSGDVATSVASSPAPPATGVGGIDYGDATPEQRRQMQEQRQREQNDEAYRQSEIERTKAVIAERQAQGLDTSAQEKYLTVNLGYTEPQPAVPSTPTSTVPPPPAETAQATTQTTMQPTQSTVDRFVPPKPTTRVPEYKPSIPVMDQQAISDYVQRQIQSQLDQLRGQADLSRERAQTDAEQILRQIEMQREQSTNRLQAALDQLRQSLTTGAEQARQGIQTSYERMREDQQDERVLQDTKFDRLNNPYSGGTDYRKALIDRERGITDRRQAEDLQSRLADIDRTLQDRIAAGDQNLAMALAELEQDTSERAGRVREDLANILREIEAKYELAANAAPAERERLMREIQNDERSYELMLRNELRQDLLADSQLRNIDFQQALQQWQANRGAYESDRQYDLQRDQYDWQRDMEERRFDSDENYRRWQQAQSEREFDHRVGQDEWSRDYTEREFDYRRDRDRIADQQFQEELDLRRERYNVDDQRWLAEFERGGQQFAEQMGFNWANLSQREKEFASEFAFKQKQHEDNMRQFAESMGLNWAQLGQREREFVEEMAFRREQEQSRLGQQNLDNLYRQWQITGVAPEGIPGIAAGTPLPGGSTSLDPNAYLTDPALSAQFGEDIQYIMQNPEQAKTDLQNNAQFFIQTYGYRGWLELMKQVSTDDEISAILNRISGGQ